MAYLRTLTALAALAALAACTPNPGDETSAGSTSASSSGSSGPTTSSPTTNPDDTGIATSTSEPATTGSTSASSSSGSSGDTDDTTTGALACNELPDFVASHAAWEAARDAHANTYYYTVLRSAAGLVPPDFCIYRTLIAVADGKVVERRFEISDMLGDPECEKSFTEQGDEVGTGMAEFVAPPATVDALYGACCDSVLHIEPADEYTVTFATDEAGLMKSCYYVANGCADGCDGGPLGYALDFETLAFGAPPPAP